jgi:uncharacterized repeat protein (TIGR03806 family)
MPDSVVMNGLEAHASSRSTRLASRLFAVLGCGALACGGLEDSTHLYEPGVGDPGPRPQPFLNLPPDRSGVPTAPNVTPATGADPRANADALAAATAQTLANAEAAGFPTRLSETGAFSNLQTLEPAPGLIPYDLLAPLWSDGAFKQRWVSLPTYGGVVTSKDGPWQFPEGTVFVKHFEMALDESQPDVRRRLETRLLVAQADGNYYGITYKWNDAQTDATVVLSKEIEPLSIVDADGSTETHDYMLPGPKDCGTCHTANAGSVLGVHTRQLNEKITYSEGEPAVNELVAWSGWGFLDAHFDETAAILAPRLASITDESASLEERVRSYWDGNCAMCHAGTTGTVEGWDARYTTPLRDEGLERVPALSRPDLDATHLIAPGHPEQSLIYLRGDSAEPGLEMPPLGRYRIDQNYIDVLGRWISALPQN